MDVINHEFFFHAMRTGELVLPGRDGIFDEEIKDTADYWSLFDNYEWWTFIPKFGLVAVDREHGFKRTPKPSAYFYKEIIENNGYNPEMLKKYLTEMPKIKDLPILL